MLRVSKFRNVIAMSSLSQRLKAIQTPSKPEKFQFNHMSMADLEESIVTFGQTHRGKSYLEVWEKHQDWIGWFLSHFENSGKEEHQRMIHFIKCKIERAELTGEGVPTGTGSKDIKLKPKMKAKAMPMKAQASAGEVPIPEMLDEEDPFEFLTEAEMDSRSVAPIDQVGPLESRVNQMEAVLGRILAHLERNVESQ